MLAATLAVLSIVVFIHVRRERLRSADRHESNVSALIENEARRFISAWRSPQAWAAATAVMGECVEQGLRRWWADPRTHILGGDRALARGDGTSAVACFRRALDRQAQKTDALKGLAVALSVCRRHAEAVETYQALLALDPHDATTRFNLAVALTRLRRFDRAERTYLQLLETVPGNHRARYNLAALYQVQGKLTLAADTYRTLIASEPTFAPAYVGLGETLLAAGQPQEATEALGQAVKLGATDTETWLSLASAAQAAGRLGRAVFAARRAAELDEADPGVWLRFGELSLELHRMTGREDLLTQAIDAWRRSLELDPSQDRLGDLLQTYSAAETRAD